MSSIGTLWTTPQQGKGKIIRAAAALGGLQVDLPEHYVHFEDNKKPEFLAKFPHGKIPAFEGKDGFKLFEGSAIARYVASLAPNSNLLGTSTKEAALVDQWVSFADSEIGSFTGVIFGLVNGRITPYTKPVHTHFAERQLRSLKTLDTILATRTFLVNERISLADLTVAAEIQRAMNVTIDAPIRAQIPNVIRHVETIVNQPQLKEIYGELQYLEKALAFTPPPKEKKEAKPAAAPAPKAEKKKKEEEEEEEDDIPKEEPKAKNPLDSLPKSSFNLEDWKRAYSNKDTRGPDGALEWFYQNYDPEGFSVWRVDFKYNNELTQTFMSSNQIGGFFNRLEASRKYLFGSMGVLGETNNSIISGVLIARGQDIKPVVDVAPDWESYEYKRLDLNNPEDKAFFEAALAWDLEVDGKKWVDGKNFK
ncbi:elongation factor 1-gamma [Dichomitus squalens]|nr:elongation factor 1-gamma [Dichomitus squalens LYAD-421 SS1]EJF60198.1 elongation factor 1-gamma [Dichomitus squalens LYAD-421 SS1]TBU40534.1 elongation factor 1-gamma [Dichomitus squalens]TBU59993.1 elongation factor 1-gamma [Dichomitus squalens]